MQKTLSVVLGDQLFYDHFALQDDSDILMIESLVESKRLHYHKLKLAYILTCMRHFRDYLISKNKTVHYYSLKEEKDFEDIIRDLKNQYGYTKIKIYDPANKFFDVKMSQITSSMQLEYETCESPMFLTTKSEFADYLASCEQNKRLRMADFYKWQRIRLNLLLDDFGQPLGGSWSHDKDNRKKLPKDIELKQGVAHYPSEHFDDVKLLIKKYFDDNPGTVDDMWLPVNHSQALSKLEYFLEHALVDFGDYEDALSAKNDFIFHSVLSPMLNIGLLTPTQILSSLNDHLATHPELIKHKINSIEGFVRQITGWREWVKGMYDNKYDQDFLKLNFFGSHNPLPDYFYHPTKYSKELEQNIPLHSVLLKVERLGWCHHIERLMILANWMTINEYDPAECYQWFASQFVDAAQWVMVPNVMGMGLFADGGIYASKPYVAGGNYIKKMGDYPHPKQWEHLWTSKFWSFLYKHEDYFRTQPRLSILLNRRTTESESKLNPVPEAPIL